MTQRAWGSNRDGGRSGAIAYCVCAVYVHCVASLLCWAALPLIGGFTPTLIVSGSMSPRINTGDIILVGKAPATDLQPGSVVTFDDPAHPGRLLTHRLVAQNPDGTYRTKGDANHGADSTSVADDQVRGVAKVVVPAVGVPLTWARNGQWLPLALWVAGTSVAAAYLRVYGHRLPLVSSWSTSLAAAPATAPVRRKRLGALAAPGLPQVVQGRRRLVVGATALVAVLAVVGLVLPRVTTSQAAFADTTKNPNNQWAAATSFCTTPGPQTLTPVADAKVSAFKATTNYGATTDLLVSSANNKDARTLLRFDLPAIPAGCAVTAELRLYASAVAAGRNIETWAAGAAWAESTVTWNTMPAAAGTAVTTPSLSAAGWMSIGVTDHVAAMYTGANDGFLLKDSVEGNNPGAHTQTFHSREATNPPQLVLTFAAPPGARPNPPSGLTATALSASRVALAWTDNATDETSYTVQRSPGGANAWSAVATLSPDATSYTDTGLTSQTAYDYRVRATNAQGDSAWSNITSATTEAAPASPPAAPSALTATTVSVSQIDLAWTDNSADEDSFTIEQSPAGAATWTQIGTVGPNVTTFSSTDLTGGTGYDFRVRASHNGGDSDWSNVATATTAACSTLSAQTLISDGDSLILQGAYKDVNFGADDVNFGVRSLNADNGRSLVRFPAPTLFGGCPVTGASLRLYEGSGEVGRTLQALTVAATWAESTVTWTTQPATTGTPATTTSALGWNAFDVMPLVGSLGTSAPYGFLIRDAVEDAGTAATHYLSPREGANPPQLVVTFG